MLSIKNIVSETTTKKSYNSDLFSNESELIELSEFNEDKSIAELKILVSTDSILDRKNEIIGRKDSMIYFLDNDKETLGVYLYNISQRVGYNGEKQTSIYRQPLTIKGFNWLLQKNNIDIEAFEKELVVIYDKAIRLQGIEVSFYDALEVALIQPSGTRKLILEDSKYRASILFNKEGLLFDVSKALIETKQAVKFTSLDEDLEADENSETEANKPNESFFDPMA